MTSRRVPPIMVSTSRRNQMTNKGYHSFTHNGHTVELTEYDDSGYGSSWFIAIDGNSTDLEPRSLRRDAKKAAITHLNYVAGSYLVGTP